ncbi:hypothetical protein GPJ56_002307 [Histomonas meleagridis]|uniref:uncharacterized protein n=1 Tax=Histomonas meleagridis TaxID=135588 RepID=UPI00355A9C02|nr:hypothetical protein GPJ56_002307 [Histomonas meleagridis]KAH0804568.1 hypothetical protein GO595_003398 [Histomonas meleagridis]
MNLNPEDELNLGIEQIKRAVKSLKQQNSTEQRLYHQQISELNRVNQENQARIEQLENENMQLRAAYNDAIAEAERLKSINASLARSLQQKEQEISRFVSLSQSLKGLLDQHDTSASTSSEIFSTDNNISFQSTSKPTLDIKPPKKQIRQYSPLPTQKIGNTSPTASRSSMFIKSAKNELTYSEFNQMMQEINSYNKNQQTRDKTIENVRNLLSPEHNDLFSQFLLMISGI